MFFSIVISASPMLAQYQLNGDAQALENNCFRLTPSQDKKVGTVWFSPMINLDQSFDITFEMNFGCDDEGADGISFSLSNDKFALGGGGHGQGFGYLWDSFNIEFDNFQNGEDKDPSFDHVAILQHGKTEHGAVYNVAGPIQTNPNNNNVEDCNFHEIRITWEAPTRTINVYFECNLRLSYTGDIASDIFEGNPNVYWGFTASTGTRSNAQTVCLKDIKIMEPLSDHTVCPGGKIQLNADERFTSYSWSPEQDLNDPNISNPIASPETSTTYFVTITDNCFEFVDSTFVEVLGDSVSINFPDSITLCLGDEIILDAYTKDAMYEWSSGETTPSISPTSSGNYIVTVTLGDQCSANEAAQIDFVALPEKLTPEFTSICPGEPILLDVSFPDASYLWQDGSTESTFLATSAGVYSVMIDHFCEDKELFIDIAFEPSCTDAYIPTAFSPNGDGINDCFTILSGSDITNINQFVVADRWGTILFQQENFQPNDDNFCWDGRLKGEDLPSGAYVYFAKITFRNESTFILKGNVSLIR